MTKIYFNTTGFVQNPTTRLVNEIKRVLGREPQQKYVRTCLSDTCNCVSHDSGYYEVECPANIPLLGIPGDVHSHGGTDFGDSLGLLKAEIRYEKRTEEIWSYSNYESEKLPELKRALAIYLAAQNEGKGITVYEARKRAKAEIGKKSLAEKARIERSRIKAEKARIYWINKKASEQVNQAAHAKMEKESFLNPWVGKL